MILWQNKSFSKNKKETHIAYTWKWFIPWKLMAKANSDNFSSICYIYSMLFIQDKWDIVTEKYWIWNIHNTEQQVVIKQRSDEYGWWTADLITPIKAMFILILFDRFFFRPSVQNVLME